MKVQIGFVSDRGDMDHERLVLSALSDVDIGDFMLIRTRMFDDKLSTDVINSFWFPYQSVKANDIVVIYSKSGADIQKKIKDDRTAHFFYWGQSAPLWDDDNVAPVLLYAPEWVAKAAKDLVHSPT